MVTGFGMPHLPTCIYRTNMLMKPVSRMSRSRHRYESNSSSVLFNPPTRSCSFTAFTTWLERSYQNLSQANFPVFKVVQTNQASAIFLVKTLSAVSDFDEKLQLNTKRPQYRSSHIKLPYSELPFCTELDFTCHANVGYCCSNRALNDFTSLTCTSINTDSTSEGNKTVALVTENGVKSNEIYKNIGKFEITGIETKEKPIYLSTDLQCLIRCPMCHRRLVNGIRYAGKKTKQMAKSKTNSSTDKPKADTEEQITDNYNKVIPKCPSNESTPYPPSSCACPPWLPCPPRPPWPLCSDGSSSPGSKQSCTSEPKSHSQS